MPPPAEGDRLRPRGSCSWLAPYSFVRSRSGRPQKPPVHDNLLVDQQVMPAPHSKIRDADRSRRAILDAAEALFAERGYQGATIAEIAAEAGVSRGTPAYFFSSKEELYRVVLGRAFNETAELVRAAPFADTSFAQAAADSLGRYLRFLNERPNFVRLVVRECLNGGRFLTGLPEHLGAIAEAMVALKNNGAVRSTVDPRHFLLSAISVCWFPLVARPLTSDLGFDPDSPEYIEQRATQVAEVLLKGALDTR